MKSLAQKRFELFQEKNKELLIYGIKNGYIQFYDEELLEKLRNIYFGGLTASIVLLCDGMCNGYCYDRGYLLAQAFIDTDDDIELYKQKIDYDSVCKEVKEDMLRLGMMI